MNLKQIAKSKTINFNTIVPAIIVISSALGFEIPAEVVAAVFSIGNFILRMITTKPISDK